MMCGDETVNVTSVAVSNADKPLLVSTVLQVTATLSFEPAIVNALGPNAPQEVAKL